MCMVTNIYPGTAETGHLEWAAPLQTALFLAVWEIGAKHFYNIARQVKRNMLDGIIIQA